MLQPDRRPLRPFLSIALAMGLSPMTATGQETPAPETEEVQPVEHPGDVVVPEWKLRLLDVAYDAASAFPLHPHSKNRAKAQEVAVRAALELRQPTRALRYTEGIENWRRGAGLAAYAYYCAEQGVDGPVAALLAQADEISRSSELTNDQEWRRERIQATIARTHLLMGDTDKAAAVTASMASAEAGVVENQRARTVDVRALEPHLARLEEIGAAGDFEQTKHALRTSAAFYARVYEDEEKREKIEDKVRSVWKRLPAEIRIEILTDLSATAARHGDTEHAVALVDEGETVFAAVRWTLEHGLEVRSALAAARHRAGDPKGAREKADEAFLDYQKGKDGIYDMFRADALLPLAEAYTEMEADETAKGLYRMALEEAVKNPNSRPRVEDLTAILCSMALHDVEPTTGIWKQIEKAREGLGDPW